MSLNLHRIQLPREIALGHGSLELVSDITKKLGLSESALIVTGPTTKHIAGQRVTDILLDNGLEVNCYVVSSNNPTLGDVKCCEEKIEELNPQIVFGVGGGTKIDIAKLSSARRGIPFVSVPTLASHDGMASPFASIKGLNRPYSVKAQSPVAVIVDTDIIINAPHRFAASGCGDVVAKLSSTRDWKLAKKRKKEYYAQYTASLALMSAQHIVDNADIIYPGSEEGLRVLLESLVSCGVAMCIGGTSKSCSGSEHLFSHALDRITSQPALHGEQCGLGTIMMAFHHGLEWEIVRDTLQKVGAPVTAEEIGIDEEHIVEALMRAVKIRPERYTILNEKPLTYDSAYRLAKATGIVD